MSLSDVLGSLGVFILLVAFVLNATKRIKTDSQLYYFLNLIGAGLAGWSALLIGFVPFIILETFWCAVATIGIVKLIKNRNVPRGKDIENV